MDINVEPLTASELSDDTKEEALERTRLLASILDDGIELPLVGTKVGLDPLLGLLPVSGDIVSGVLSLYIPLEAARLGVPMTTVTKMLAYIGLDVVGGAVPILGNLFDVFWRANRRNVNLLEDYLGADESA